MYNIFLSLSVHHTVTSIHIDKLNDTRLHISSTYLQRKNRRRLSDPNLRFTITTVTHIITGKPVVKHEFAEKIQG